MIKLKPLDFAAIMLSISIAAIMGFSVYSGYTAPRAVEITLADSKLIYPLDTERRIEAKGPLGDSIIIIDDEGAHFESSPCPDKLCVKAGDIAKTGEWNGCLPNRVFIRITGDEESGKNGEHEKIDAVSY